MITIATYNSGVNYNEAFYASGPVMLLFVDNGTAVDFISYLSGTLAVPEAGVGAEAASILATNILTDGGNGIEDLFLQSSFTAADNAQGTDSPVITASFSTSDTAQGEDSAATTECFFLIDSRNVLQPLGVVVLRDSRQDLLPGTRENTEIIPGRHGEMDFGSELQPRAMELHVATDTNQATREQLKREFAKYLNPLAGVKTLAFADDLQKTYYVKYAGKIDISQWPDYMEFTIPFKASDPFIIGSFEKKQIGSGTLTNEGTIETPLVVTITGPVTNPSVVVGGVTLAYTGALAAGDVMVIDTGKMTVTFNGVNALSGYSGGFPKLQPGDTVVTAAAAGTTTFSWRDRWI